MVGQTLVDPLAPTRALGEELGVRRVLSIEEAINRDSVIIITPFGPLPYRPSTHPTLSLYRTSIPS